MTELCNKQDEKALEELKKIQEEFAKKSGFMKLMPYNNPKCFILSGALSSLLDGALMPMVGLILSKLLTYMTADWAMLAYMARLDKDWTSPSATNVGEEYLRYNIEYYSAIMGCLALASGLGSMTQKISFGFLGENVTQQVRRVLYESILRKNVGWFDEKENGTSVLTSAMAQDTAIINGVSTESLAPQLEGTCALVVGLVIGFIYCW